MRSISDELMMTTNKSWLISSCQQSWKREFWVELAAEIIWPSNSVHKDYQLGQQKYRNCWFVMLKILNAYTIKTSGVVIIQLRAADRTESAFQYSYLILLEWEQSWYHRCLRVTDNINVLVDWPHDSTTYHEIDIN